MMDSASAALVSADKLLGELQGGNLPTVSRAPTMGQLQKVRYTHVAMIELILENPWISQDKLAAHFGYTASWISNILASDAFQAALAARREEIIDPVLKATIEERFRALVIQSLDVLQKKLASPQVSDNVAIRAAELGAKALGVGGHAAPKPVESSNDRLIRLANRLTDLLPQQPGKVINGEAQVIQEAPTASLP